MRTRTKDGLWLVGAGLVLAALVLLVAPSAQAVLVGLALAVLLLVLGVLRLAVGGVGVVVSWLVRYRRSVPIAVLGGIIAEKRDDLIDAGLAVERKSNRAQKMTTNADGSFSLDNTSPPVYAFPSFWHGPDPAGIRVIMTPVRGAQTQEDLVNAVPRLRSAWGVDRIDAIPVGARDVEFVLHVRDVLSGVREADLPPAPPDAEGETWLT